MSGYWFRDDEIPALVRPCSTVFECDDLDVLARIISIHVA